MTDWLEEAVMAWTLDPFPTFLDSMIRYKVIAFYHGGFRPR